MNSSRFQLAAITMLCALLVAALPFNVSARALQDDSSFKTTLTEQEVRVDGPNYALDEVALEEYPHGRGERIYISSTGTRSFAEIAFFDDSDSPRQTIDVMMADFESTSQQFAILESGDENGVYYALATFSISADLSGYFYIEVAEDLTGNIDLAQSLYAINEDFAEQLTIASSEIRLGGNAFLGETVIDVGAAIADYEAILASTPAATPGPSSYSFNWIDSTVKVQPPLTLDWDATTDVLESVFISSEGAYAYVGYLDLPQGSPESALDSIISGAPAGEEAPVLLHSVGNAERILAVYRIAIDGDVTVMIIEINAASGELWQVEALAAPRDAVLAEVEVFQNSVTIDGAGFLDALPAGQLETILRSDQP